MVVKREGLLRTVGVIWVVCGFMGCGMAYKPYKFVRWQGGYAVQAGGLLLVEEFTAAPDGTFPADLETAQRRFECRKQAVEAFHNNYSRSDPLPPKHPFIRHTLNLVKAVVLFPIAPIIIVLDDGGVFEPSAEVKRKMQQEKEAARAVLWEFISKQCG